MAGIYLHIPFCKKACNYCDFHFSTSFKLKEEVINCILQEIRYRKNYLGNQEIKTIYFGGGTPSLLEKNELKSILDCIYQEFTVSQNAEITLEANPDDLTIEKLRMFKQNKINRLSIGIQSFVERDLLFMNRSHTYNQAIDSVKNAKEIGFQDLTIDLIYGIPNLTKEDWKKNIEQAISLEVNHISAYCLTSEKKTAMHYDITKGKYALPSDEITSFQFHSLIKALQKNGYEQYEISNFSKNGHHSKHNSSYWKQTHYLGIGPSAHSFNGKSRQWNIANNAKYIRGAKTNNWEFEIEELEEKTKYNDYILTSLRTKWGVDLDYIKTNFHTSFHSHFLTEVTPFLEKNQLSKTNNTFTLSSTGKLLADYIASELFFVE